MTKQEIINDIASNMMYEDEFLEYAEAIDIATRIYIDLYEEEEEEDEL